MSEDLAFVTSLRRTPIRELTKEEIDRLEEMIKKLSTDLQSLSAEDRLLWRKAVRVLRRNYSGPLKKKEPNFEQEYENRWKTYRKYWNKKDQPVFRSKEKHGEINTNPITVDRCKRVNSPSLSNSHLKCDAVSEFGASGSTVLNGITNMSSETDLTVKPGCNAWNSETLQMDEQIASEKELVVTDSSYANSKKNSEQEYLWTECNLENYSDEESVGAQCNSKDTDCSSEIDSDYSEQSYTNGNIGEISRKPELTENKQLKSFEPFPYCPNSQTSAQSINLEKSVQETPKSDSDNCNLTRKMFENSSVQTSELTAEEILTEKIEANISSVLDKLDSFFSTISPLIRSIDHTSTKFPEMDVSDFALYITSKLKFPPETVRNDIIKFVESHKIHVYIKLGKLGITVKCLNDDEVSKLRTILEHDDTIRSTLNVFFKKPLLEKLIILNIPSEIKPIYVLNYLKQYVKFVNLIKRLESKDTYRQIVLIDAVSAKKLLHQRFLILGFSKCSISKYISIKKCTKCYSFQHNTRSCDSIYPLNTYPPVCVNCLYVNTMKNDLSDNINTDHPSNSSSCPTYIKEVNKARKEYKNSNLLRLVD